MDLDHGTGEKETNNFSLHCYNRKYTPARAHTQYGFLFFFSYLGLKQSDVIIISENQIKGGGFPRFPSAAAPVHILPPSLFLRDKLYIRNSNCRAPASCIIWQPF